MQVPSLTDSDWIKVSHTPGVKAACFLHYQNQKEGIITRIAMNLSPVKATILKEEKKFYVCIGFKEENSKMVIDIFKKHFPLAEESTIKFKGEKGILIYLPLSEASKDQLCSILDILLTHKGLSTSHITSTLKEEYLAKFNASVEKS